MNGPFEQARMNCHKFGANLSMAVAVNAIVQAIDMAEKERARIENDAEQWRTAVFYEKEIEMCHSALANEKNWLHAPEA